MYFSNVFVCRNISRNKNFVFENSFMVFVTSKEGDSCHSPRNELFFTCTSMSVYTVTNDLTEISHLVRDDLTFYVKTSNILHGSDFATTLRPPFTDITLLFQPRLQ